MKKYTEPELLINFYMSSYDVAQLILSGIVNAPDDTEDDTDQPTTPIVGIR